MTEARLEALVPNAAFVLGHGLPRPVTSGLLPEALGLRVCFGMMVLTSARFSGSQSPTIDDARTVLCHDRELGESRIFAVRHQERFGATTLVELAALFSRMWSGSLPTFGRSSTSFGGTWHVRPLSSDVKRRKARDAL